MYLGDAWDYGSSGLMFEKIYGITPENYYWDLISKGFSSDDAWNDLESKLHQIYYNKLYNNNFQKVGIRDIPF